MAKGHPEESGDILKEHRYQIMHYDEMTRAIRACGRVDDVKKIRDKALAVQIYAAQAKNLELEQQATRIRLRAEARCGEMMTAMAEKKERRTQGGRQKAKSDRPILKEDLQEESVTDNPPTLADLGISPQQSSDWQKMATIPDEVFEGELNKPNPTTAGMVSLADQLAGEETRPKRRPRKPRSKSRHSPLESSPEANWLWGRILDFDQRGILKSDPTILADCTERHMMKDMKRIVPKLAAWLLKFIE